MKGLALIIAICFPVAMFAQGKISLSTDNNHLAYFDPSVPGIGGQAASTGIEPVPLLVDLYMGTSSTALSLYSSTTLANASNPGKWLSVSVQATNPPIAGGTSVFIVTQIRNASAAPEATLDPSLGLDLSRALGLGFSYYGWSQEFTFTLGSAVTYPTMYNSPTWAAGTFPLDSVAPGAKGAVAIFAAPEPNTAALLFLGSAALLSFHRRKSA